MRSLHVQALNASKLEFLTELCSYSVALRSALRSATVWAWTESIMCIELIVIWDGMGVWTQKLREKLQASYRETTWSYYMKATGKLLHVENSGERRLFVASRYSVHRAAHRPPSGSWVVHVEICINSILLRDAIGLKTDPANRKKRAFITYFLVHMPAATSRTDSSQVRATFRSALIASEILALDLVHLALEFAVFGQCSRRNFRPESNEYHSTNTIRRESASNPNALIAINVLQL